MKCSNEDRDPTKAQALEYILIEIKNFTRVMHDNPISAELISMVQMMEKTRQMRLILQVFLTDDLKTSLFHLGYASLRRASEM